MGFHECSAGFACLIRFLSSPIVIRVPFFSYYSVLISEPRNKKGKRVLLRNLVLKGCMGALVCNGVAVTGFEAEC